MPPPIKTVITVVIAMAFLFMIAGVVIFPYMGQSYHGSCNEGWACNQGRTGVNCTLPLTENASYVAPSVGQHSCQYMCENCQTQQSWSTANIGLVVLIFFMALIGLAVKFVRT